MKFVFATNNNHKLKEVRQILQPDMEILSLKDIGCTDILPETGNSLHANAYQKANYIFEKFGMNCFADDSGLEVEALDGRPGVYSARFAGKNANDQENIRKLLIEMKGVENRKAKFRTVISLVENNASYFFEGIISGTITEEIFGTNGFGYDPVFKPNESELTFAEISAEQKNKMSHRSIAVDKLIRFLFQKV